MYRLSVIVPVYNVENYLRECLDSICGQEIEDIQVICVEDCSTDSSPDILKEYEEKYSYIEVYRHTENSGLSAARNTGMKYATGEYIMFVDSDDYIAGGYVLNRLLKISQQKQLDILWFNTDIFYEDDFKSALFTCESSLKCTHEETTGIDLLCSLMNNKEMCSAVWSAMYKRKYFDDLGLRFINGILHEDNPFTFSALLNAKNVLCVNDTLYYYRQRNDSLIHNKCNYQKRLEGYVLGYIDILNTWMKYIRNNMCSELNCLSISLYLSNRLLAIKDVYIKLLSNGESIKDKMIADFMDNILSIQGDKLDNYFYKKDLEKIRQKGKVSVYGAGDMASRIVIQLQQENIQIENIFVTNLANNSNTFFGMEVKEYDESLVGNSDDLEYVVIGISVKSQKEIVEQLEKNMGIYIIKTIAV